MIGTPQGPRLPELLPVTDSRLIPTVDCPGGSTSFELINPGHSELDSVRLEVGRGLQFLGLSSPYGILVHKVRGFGSGLEVWIDTLCRSRAPTRPHGIIPSVGYIARPLHPPPI